MRKKVSLGLLVVVLALTTVLAGLMPQNAAAESPVNFPDPGLQSAIREAIGKPTGDILPSDLVSLTNLIAYSKDISDLTGLNYCTNLATLDLRWNQISDILPLSGLTSLTWLELMVNQVSDLSPLSGLTNLTYLRLNANPISDISPLSGLTNLTMLGLYSMSISDISPLSGLTNLTWLELGVNQVSDISPLSGLTNLTQLYLRVNQISDISPLLANTGLGSGDDVYLEGNPLSPASLNTYIPELQARGVTVYYDGPIPPVPELSTILLMGIGLLAIGGLVWFRKRSAVVA